MLLHNALIERPNQWRQAEIGYYSFGVPAIFLDSKCIVQDDGILLSSVKKLSVGDVLSLREFQSVQLYATVFHELRHFHDSLISPMLHSLYGMNVSENYLRWLMIEAMCEEPSLSPADAVIASGGNEFYQQLARAKAEYRQRFSPSFETLNFRIRGVDIGKWPVQAFFELSAVFQEVAAVMALSGERGGLEYWGYKKRESTLYYTEIFDAVISKSENIHRAFDMAGSFFHASIFLPGNPMITFLGLLAGELDLTKLLSEEEDILDLCKRAINEQRGLNIEIPLLPQFDTRMPLKAIEQLRRSLVENYLFEFGLRLDRYFESIDTLPMPVIYFLPSEAELSHKRGRLYPAEFLDSTFGPVMALSGLDLPTGRYIGAGAMRPAIRLTGFAPNEQPPAKTHEFIQMTDDMIFSQWCVGHFFQNEVDAVPVVHAKYVDRAREIGFPLGQTQ